MKIKRFIFNPFQENTFVLYDKSRECVIIDSGCYEKAEENTTTIDDLKYLKDSIEDDNYLGDKDWATKLQIKIENYKS